MFVRYRPLTRENLEALQRRIESIPASRAPRWGSLDAPQLFAHVRRSLEMPLGDYLQPDRSTWLTRLLRPLVFSRIPWPHGLKSPRYFFPNPDDAERERARLLEILARFVREVEQRPDRVAASPVFGRMTMVQWAKAQGRHLEHHLRQFNV